MKGTNYYNNAPRPTELSFGRVFPYYMSSKKTKLSDARILKDSQTYPWMFGLLVDRYQEAFLRRSYYILRSQDEAEDAVQDTFIKIYKFGHQFSERSNASFQSWAYKILTNTCHTYASRKTRSSNHVKAMDFSDLDTSREVEFLSVKERTSYVQSVLNRLPDRMSRLLSLYFLEDKSYEEIAIIEDTSLSAVRSGLFRARRQFKELALKMI